MSSFSICGIKGSVNDYLLPAQLIATSKYRDLNQQGRIQAEYVWIGGSGEDLRCKTKTLDAKPNSAADLPIWNFDGSSTGQASGHDSEVILKPAAIFRDPFRLGENILVMCDCYTPDDKPVATNNRAHCLEIMNKAKNEHPWFGIEQEYTLFANYGWPLGWPKGGFPGPQGPYYCSVGTDVNFGRTIVENHYKACLYAGVKISGINAEVMPGQWEYQVGPCEGIDIGDHLWMSRYIMYRICEEQGVVVTFDPKPIPGDWNGAGCHTNFSTEEMRKAPGGFDAIKKAILKLEKKHMEHIAVYGSGNERRLTGLHETAPIDKFSWGIAHRGASVRVGRQVEKDKCGYFEDRRPASNIDPYIVSAKIVQTVCLE